jgi:hypothetical protein
MATSELVVADDGDVVFTLRGSLGESCSVRVSSLVLSYTSPVFKSMLGPNFSEGQDSRSFQQPKTIDLPDDDPTAMVRLCRMLHFNQSADGEKPLQEETTPVILQVAILADKYDCMRTALPSLRLALLELSVKPTPHVGYSIHSPADLAAVAYLLRLEDLCRLFTRRMVLDMDDSFIPLLREAAGQVLPASLLRKSPYPPNQLHTN